VTDPFLSEPASHSRLATWESCPLKFRLRYIDRVPAATTTVEAFLGTLVHESLEALYAGVQAGAVASEDEVLAGFTAAWRARCDDTVRIVRRGTGAEDYRRRGEEFLSRYYREHAPFDADETLATERRVEAELQTGGGYAFVGYVDRLARARDGAIEIHDYKTSASLPSDQKLRADRQLRLYEIALRPEIGEETPVRLVWNYLAHGKRIVQSNAPAELDRVRREAVRLIDAIRAACDFPPRESALCDWCEYREDCPVGRRRAPRR